MKLRFYSGLLLGLLAISLGLYDIYISPDPNLFRASAGIVVGSVVIIIALTTALRDSRPPK